MLALRPTPALRPALAVAAVAAVLSTAGCSSGGAKAETYDISAGDTTCNVEKTQFAAGDVAFKVENTGSDVTEVYVYAEQDGGFSKIVGEVENIGPGTSRDLAVSLPAGAYQVACKPGMTGDGIRTDITVTGQSSSGSSSEEESGLAYDRELEFSVTAPGRVQAPSGPLTAHRGERIEFKLHNGSNTERYLKLLDPDGQQVSAVAAEAGAEAEFIAELTTSGDYTVSIYREGAESSAISTSLAVRK